MDGEPPRDGEPTRDTGRTHEFGPPDLPSLVAVRDTFERHEPLVDESKLDDPIDPYRLAIRLLDGFGEPGRFDVRWSTTDCYSFHYTESGLDFRFDAHPNPHSPREHFHPPDGLAERVERIEPSCIAVELPELVTLAVLQEWRRAWEADDPSLLNRGDDPP